MLQTDRNRDWKGWISKADALSMRRRLVREIVQALLPLKHTVLPWIPDPLINGRKCAYRTHFLFEVRDNSIDSFLALSIYKQV